MRRPLALATTLGLTLLSASALAESYDDGSCGSDQPSWRSSWNCDSMSAIAIGVYGAGSVAVLDSYELDTAAGQDTPGPLTDRRLWLDGRGYLAGGGARILLQSDGGFRLGFGAGIFHLGDVELGHDELPRGVKLDHEDVFVGNLELYFGKAFDARYFYPYIDLKGSVNLIGTRIALDVEPHGFVGNASYQVPSFTLAPRLGAFIPLDGDFYMDAAASYGLFGAEGLGGHLGFGIWDDL